ncbi:MAG: dynamin family protein, partial [Gemmataceae bacterium]
MNHERENELTNTLNKGAARLRDARSPGELADFLDHLAGQVDKPCVLAVVGRMKAGKSTFINALLGEDLAPVGNTETTATIN